MQRSKENNNVHQEYEETPLQRFTALSGTIDYGKQYEVAILIFVSLKLCFDDSIENFYISSNDTAWGKFDDAVFQIFQKDAQESVIAIQSKHTTRSITVENLNNSSGDYSLEKHYKSVKDVLKHSYKNLDNLFLIWWTTGRYNGKINELTWKKLKLFKKDCEELQFLRTSSDPPFQFHVNVDDCLKSAFFSRFFIFSNQLEFKKLMKLIRDLIQKKFSGCKDISEELFTYFENWRQGKLYKICKQELILEICQHLFSPFLTEPRLSDNFSPFEVCNRIFQHKDVIFLENFRKNGHHLWSPILRMISTKKFVWENPSIHLNEVTGISKDLLWNKTRDSKISLKNLYFAYWKSGKAPLILRVKSVDCELFVKILAYCQQFVPRKFVIYTKESNIEMFFENFPKFRYLGDLNGTETFKEITNELQITIQTRFNIFLKDLIISDANFLENMTMEMLLEISTNPIVGRLEIHIPEIYIERRIYEFHMKIEGLKYIYNEAVIILSDVQDYNFLEHYENKFFQKRMLEFLGDEISEKLASGKNIIVVDLNANLNLLKLRLKMHYHMFLLTKTSSSDYSLKWLESSTSIDHLKQYSSDQGSVIRDENLLSFSFNSLNVINASPGMGKSTLINKMCETCSEDYWILKINLIEHTTFLQNYKITWNPVEYLFEQTQDQEKLTKICFESFCRTGKMLFLIDGFDEVVPEFEHSALELLKYLHSKKFVVWVTTRPAAVEILEKTFNVLSRSVLPFDEEDRNIFFAKYCQLHEEARQIFNANKKYFDDHFVKIPLQLQMVCDSIIENRNLKSFDILDLYENCIRRKFRILEERYLKNVITTFKTMLIDNHISCHETLSLMSLFKIIPSFNDASLKFLENVKTGQERSGIITKLNQENLPVFVHQTYAEYFAASWLSKNWTSKRVHKVVFQIMIEENFEMVRLFFDKIQARGIKVFEIILSDNFSVDDLQKLSSADLRRRDKAGRSALHVACAWRSPKNIQILDFLLNKGLSLGDCDDLFKNNPVYYADLTRNIPAIDTILSYRKIDFTSLTCCADIKFALNTCIRENCLNFLQQFGRFLNKTKWTVSSEFDDLLFMAVESKNVESVKILLSIDEFKRHVLDDQGPGRAILQYALMLEVKGIVLEFMEVAESPYKIALDGASDDVKKVLKELKKKFEKKQ